MTTNCALQETKKYEAAQRKLRGRKRDAMACLPIPECPAPSKKRSRTLARTFLDEVMEQDKLVKSAAKQAYPEIKFMEDIETPATPPTMKLFGGDSAAEGPPLLRMSDLLASASDSESNFSSELSEENFIDSVFSKWEIPTEKSSFLLNEGPRENLWDALRPDVPTWGL
jgi:hypothetical protein